MAKLHNGCVTEVDMFRTFRGELDAAESQMVLRHILGCELCHDQWKRFEVEERVAEGIRAAASGDARRADESSSLRMAAELPEQLNIAGFEVMPGYIDGGQARVYRARHLASQEDVAIKVFHNSILNEGGRARFLRELKSLARLRHPNVIPIRSEGEVHGHAYMVTPWVEGMPLDEYMAHSKPMIRQRVQLIARICSALDHAHKRGVMHLDLKPSNVRVDETGEPMVMDFGLARLVDAEVADSTMLAWGVAGTPPYMAPEQVRTRDDVDIRADVYSLGLLLYEVAAGRRARCADSAEIERLGVSAALQTPAPIRTIVPKLAYDLAAIVDKSVAAYRAARYQTAEALEDDLRRWLEGKPVKAMVGRPVYQFFKFCRNHFAIIISVAAVCLAVGGIIAHQRQLDAMVNEHYARLEIATREANRATGRSLSRAYQELSDAYRRLGETELADLYAARSRAALDRAEAETLLQPRGEP